MASTKMLVLLSMLVLACQAQQSFRLANIYADEMVLQMAPKSTQIWGFGDVGASVSVDVNGQQVSTTVAGDGKWSVRLAPQAEGGPYQLTASQGADVVSINVWFGDVWVCSGQSNMEMAISATFNPAEETDKAVTYQNLRLMQVNNVVTESEIDELTSIRLAWSAPTSQNVPGFSSLCIMYGERLSDSLGGRPIGLIDTTWGGTRIEAWVSTRVFATCNTPPSSTSGDKNSDHALWNGMLHPLTKMAVRGAIWYQGEANTGYNSNFYACQMQQLIEDWKNTFVDGNVAAENGLAFPFGIAQIGPTSGGGVSNYGYLRWHQTYDQGVLPNSNMPEAFMAAVYDTTDPGSPTGDIHPRDKQTVADRLANSAKTFIYNENWKMNGPVPVSAVENTPGVWTVTYDMDITVQATNGFSIRRGDGSWVETTIAGSSGRNVDVNVEAGATNLAYAWSGVVCDYKACSIYSADAEVLPANVWQWNLAKNRPGF